MLAGNLKTEQSFRNYYARFEQFLRFVAREQKVSTCTEVIKRMKDGRIPDITFYSWFHLQASEWQVNTVKSKISAINHFLVVLINKRLQDVCPALPRLVSAWAKQLCEEAGKMQVFIFLTKP